MVRVLESNESLAHRMSLMASSMAMSTISHRNHDSASILSEETVQRSSDAASSSTLSQESTQYTLIEHAFEEDLQKSSVYQRSTSQDPRFSIASSAQVSLSWSMLSGLSLSNISNIAVQSLPIFEKDLENSELYSFGSGEFNGINVPNDVNQFQDRKPFKNLDASSVRHWPAPPKPFEFPSLPSSHILQANARIPVAARKHIKKSSISSPKLVSSTYMYTTVNTAAPLQLSESEINLGSKDESPDEHSNPVSTANNDDNDENTLNSPVQENQENPAGGYNILYIAASLFEFNIAATKSEAGYPYLIYQCGEVSWVHHFNSIAAHEFGRYLMLSARRENCGLQKIRKMSLIQLAGFGASTLPDLY
jgi:hypothetical protein